MSVLKELTDRAEETRAGILTLAEDHIAEHQDVPLADHVEAFIQHLRLKRCSQTHIDNTRRYLNRMTDECHYGRLRDLNRESLERWLLDQADNGMSARTRNAYRVAMVSFCNWCMKTDRLITNPFKDVPRADERADRRRRRRALTEDELHNLLYVARWRPLAEYGRKPQGAIDALPTLPLESQPSAERAAMLATGTETARSALAPMLAPRVGKASTSESIRDNMADCGR